MKNPWEKDMSSYFAREHESEKLQNNVQWAIDLLQENGVGWKYEGHTTTLNTNDLEIIKGLLILLKEKVG